MGSWMKSIVRRKSSYHHAKITSSKQDSASNKEKQKGWALWKNSGNGEKESTQVNVTEEEEEEGIDNLCDSPCIRTPVDGHGRAEQAAICIQAAFRGFMARRSVHALKRLARLQESIKSQNSYKQSIASVHAIRDFVRIQAQIHSQRASKRPIAPQKPAVLPKEVETEADWCHSVGTLEQIQSRIQQRQEAAIKRERALAYASTNQVVQRKRNPKLKSECLLEYDLDSSTWNWISLDNWMINGVHQGSNTDKERSKAGSQISKPKNSEKF